MPHWYVDWLIPKLVPLTLHGLWEVGIDPLEPGQVPDTEAEERRIAMDGK